MESLSSFSRSVSIPRLVAPAWGIALLLAVAAHGQSVQEITFTSTQIGGTWATGGCSTATEKGSPTNGATATMTWPDTTGVTVSSGIAIQIEANWKFWCSGGSYNLSINGTSIGVGGTPSNTNNCSCNATPFATSTQTITAGNFTWNGNGSNTITFTHSSNQWIGVMNGSSGWSVRITVTVLNAPPAAPTNLHQAAVSGGSGQAVGFLSDSTIYFRGTVADPDQGTTVGIQAEVLPSTTAFGASISGTVVATPAASFVPAGSVAEALLDFTTAGLPSGAYHWRARGIDTFGAVSAWVVFDSQTVHFTTDLVPPAPTPGPYSPSGVQLVFEFNPNGDIPFSWGASFDPSGPPLPVLYRLEVSSSENFASLIFDTVTPGTNFTANLIASENLYYWRVSAVDAAGNHGAPSAAQPFQVSWTIPPSNDDRQASCGVSTGTPPAFLTAAAVLAVLLGFAARRRSTS